MPKQSNAQRLTEINEYITSFHKAHPKFKAKNLRHLRQSMFISQRDLAIVSGVSRETIIRIEAGAVKPYGPTVLKMAKALGIDPAEMNRIADRSDIR